TSSDLRASIEPRIGSSKSERLATSLEERMKVSSNGVVSGGSLPGATGGKRPFTDSDWTEHLDPAMKDLVQLATPTAKTYSGISEAVGIVKAFLTFAGFLSSDGDEMTKQLKSLHDHLDAVGEMLSWQMSEADREKRLADEEAAVTSAAEIVKSGG